MTKHRRPANPDIEQKPEQRKEVKKARAVHLIAKEVDSLWKRPYFGAVPYLEAMKTMTNVEDAFGLDPGREIVLYFLANAQTWRGPDARRIKAELNDMLGRATHAGSGS